ncbi:MAG TPA: hypothetical protein PKD55_12970 [Bellilinea sp.]|nr:hypothetical protein [Bellilinea sp.]
MDMDRLLVKTLQVINGLSAILIVGIGAFMGNSMIGAAPLGVILGGIGGLIVAAIACGTISCLLLIEHHLSKIAVSGRTL